MGQRFYVLICRLKINPCTVKLIKLFLSVQTIWKVHWSNVMKSNVGRTLRVIWTQRRKTRGGSSSLIHLGTLSVVRTILQPWMKGWLETNLWERVWKEAVVAQFNIRPAHLRWGIKVKATKRSNFGKPVFGPRCEPSPAGVPAIGVGRSVTCDGDVTWRLHCTFRDLLWCRDNTSAL
jgi:hypothetical protein